MELEEEEAESGKWILERGWLAVRCAVLCVPLICCEIIIILNLVFKETFKLLVERNVG